MGNRRIVFPQDIATFCGCSLSTAHRKYREIRKTFNLRPGNTVTVYHLAIYFEVPVSEVLAAIFDVGEVSA